MSIVGGLAAGVAAGAIGNWLSGDSDRKASRAVQPRLLGFRGGGMSLRRNGDVLTLNPSKEGRTALQGIKRANLNAGSQYALLGKKIRPGFGLLTNAMVRAIDTRRRATTSDLRDQFARRRLSGSSFASDALSRTEAEFANLEKQARAEAFVQEMKMTQENIALVAQARSNAFTAMLSQLNLEGKMAAEIAIAGQNTLSGLAQAQAQILQGAGDRSEAMFAPLVEGISQLGAGGFSLPSFGGGGGGGSYSGGAWNPADIGMGGP